MPKELQDLFDKLRGLQDQANTIIKDENAKAEDIEKVTNDIKTTKAKIEAYKTAQNAFGEGEGGTEGASAQSAQPQAPSRQLNGQQLPPANMSTQPEMLDDAGFKNLGEFLHCVKNGDPKGRMKNLSTGDAGILIPPQFGQTILQMSDESEIVMPNATNIPAGDPPDAPLTLPYLKQGADGVLGGVELNWTEEAKTIQDVKDPQIGDLTLTPNEVNGTATVNNKTLANWEASGALIQTLMQQAWINGRDMKFLNGSGVGTPLGILQADGAIEVTRKTANTFTYADAVTMISKILPQVMGDAFWTIHITLLPAVMQMSDGNGRLIFVQGDATKGVPPTLAGFPIKWTGKTSQAGTRGDVIFACFKHYLTKQGSGPFVAVSEHVKFQTNQTVFKITANIDGQPWVNEPLTLQDKKTQVSPYIILK